MSDFTETYYITDGVVILKCVQDTQTKQPIETTQFGTHDDLWIGLCVALAIIPLTGILWRVIDYLAR